ncbi:hypothetical protein FYM13_08520 [Staphylococcus aureus]|nr:hypothetical protein FYM10_09710 [Staphylococcus aureus]TYN92679.1 hypothetical protein FYM11_08025 [Staphylococcus aureus]TYN99387.1 hypothetical protein FYM13_08520 [Staphylococcus aureus]TYO01238.1 hypothetical protein FYM19_03225 [Staphylococcus aureus]TYO04272.1 hypothetical protein FYM33_06305 [Staphylococcus aureus]
MCTEPRKLYFGLAHLMLYEQVRFCYILSYLHANYINVNVLAIFYRLIVNIASPNIYGNL